MVIIYSEPNYIAGDSRNSHHGQVPHGVVSGRL